MAGPGPVLSRAQGEPSGWLWDSDASGRVASCGCGMEAVVRTGQLVATCPLVTRVAPVDRGPSSCLCF